MSQEGRKGLGVAAEDAVVQYAEEQGWRVLERNAMRPWGELDIIAKEGATLVCIEVKAGYTREGFSPEDHFDARKREKVVRACHAYALHNGFSENECRVDLATVTVDSIRARARIRYYKNAGG